MRLVFSGLHFMRFPSLLAIMLIAFLAVGASAEHWTYPGHQGDLTSHNLLSHLQGFHGVSTAGLSREQMLNLHDSIHEGRGYQTTGKSSVSFNSHQQPQARRFRLFRR